MSTEPPCDVETEKALLGAVLVDNTVMDEIRLVVPEPGMFWRTSHAHVYHAMLQLHDEGGEIDYVTVRDRMVRNGTLDHLGSVDGAEFYLHTCAEQVPSAYGAERYARIVRRLWAQRAVIRACGDATGIAQDPARDDPAQEAIDLLDTRLTEIEQARETVPVTGISDAITQAEQQRRQIEEWRRANEGALPGLSSGYSDLDQLTLGFRGGELVVIGARPSQGKTAMLLGMMGEVCLTARPEQKALLFSFEMGTVEVAQRLICQIAGVDLRAYRMGTLSHQERGEVHEAAALVRPAAWVVDHQELRVPAMRAIARRVARKHQLVAVFVDYLQLVRDDEKIDRHLQIGNISRGLKAMARELDVPVITAAQLNRQVEHRGDSRPKLADLRESGSIENDADQVLLLHRKTPDSERHTTDFLDYDVLVEKNRNGPTGAASFYFHKQSARFVQRSALATGAPA